MITRSYDPKIMQTAVELAHNPANEEINYEEWLANEKNLMFHEEGNVGLATYEYPGVYSIHWFFLVRGREAMKMSDRMFDKFFSETECKAIRGLTPLNNKAARWLARQIGCTSYGIIECNTGPHELFCMTRDDFYKRKQ